MTSLVNIALQAAVVVGSMAVVLAVEGLRDKVVVEAVVALA